MSTWLALLGPVRCTVPIRLPSSRTATLPQLRQVEATMPTRFSRAPVRTSVAPLRVVVR
jgi:hypothetical protein